MSTVTTLLNYCLSKYTHRSKMVASLPALDQKQMLLSHTDTWKCHCSVADLTEFNIWKRAVQTSPQFVWGSQVFVENMQEGTGTVSFGIPNHTTLWASQASRPMQRNISCLLIYRLLSWTQSIDHNQLATASLCQGRVSPGKECLKSCTMALWRERENENDSLSLSLFFPECVCTYVYIYL